MEEFSVHEFEFRTNDPHGKPGPWKLTSLVMSENEFNSFIDFLVANMTGIYGSNGERTQSHQIEALRAERHIPMIARGTKTEPIFQKYGIASGFMSVIVRGEGFAVMEKYMRDPNRGQA